MTTRFVVHCPEAGPDTQHVNLSTAYREHRQLEALGFTPEISTIRVHRNQFAWGGV